MPQAEEGKDEEGVLDALPCELALPLPPPPPLAAEGVGKGAVAQALLEGGRVALPAPAEPVPSGGKDGVPPQALALGQACALAVPAAVPVGVHVACTPLGVARGQGHVDALSVGEAHWEGLRVPDAQ